MGIVLALLWKLSRGGSKGAKEFKDQDYLFEEDTLATYKEDDMPLTHVDVAGDEFAFIPEFDDDLPNDASAAPAPVAPPPKPSNPPLTPATRPTLAMSSNSVVSF